MPTVDITVGSDADFSRSFVWAMSGGSPISLVGSSLLLQVRSSPTDPRVLFEASTDNNYITITNAAGGTFTLHLPYSFLKTLPEAGYVQSLVRKITATGWRDEVWSGALNQVAQPTRDGLTT